MIRAASISGGAGSREEETDENNGVE